MAWRVCFAGPNMRARQTGKEARRRRSDRLWAALSGAKDAHDATCVCIIRATEAHSFKQKRLQPKL